MRRILVSLFAFSVLPLLVMAQEPAPVAQSPEAVRAENPAEVPAQPQQRDAEPPESKTPQAPDTTPATSKDKIELPPRAQAFKFRQIDLDLLKQVDAFDRYMEEKGWVYNDSATIGYLEKLGLALVPKQTPENVKWRFRVLRDPDVNAFALPNGSIYVNSGLLSRMENEAQLAGVLAHEITHVTNRHTYLQYHSVRKKAVAVHIMIAAASAAYYAGANPAIVNAMGNLLPMIVISTIFGYSRELEHESDVYAVNILNAQGFDLKEFARGFELLKKGPEVDLSEEPVFWASHPKLTDRVQYVSSMAKQLQANATGFRSEPASYLAGTKSAIRHDADLTMMLGRPRTAVAIAQRLITLEPNRPEHHVLLGDAYRTLGGRTPVPAPEEQSEKGKSEARKRIRKMTLIEYDKALLADSTGLERWQANCVRSERALQKALEMDPANAEAHRGLGFLYERQERRAAAIENFKKYLELAPNAQDARRIRMHVEALEKQVAAEKVTL